MSPLLDESAVCSELAERLKEQVLKNPDHRTLTFPKDFLWGAATSAHQVEGMNTASDWWHWEQQDRVKDKSGQACRHYERYREDFNLAASLHHRAHRFSIEWSRIQPKPGEWNQDALQHYVDVVDALRERNLEPIVTLHHFTTPQWLTAQGTWANPEIVNHFSAYTEKVVEALGSRVRYWITINEPMVLTNMHYIEGAGPPGAQDFSMALKVIKNLIHAHVAAYQIIHDRAAGYQGQLDVGLAKATMWFYPHRAWSALDQIISWMANRIFNTAFLDAVTTGCWSVPGVATWKIPEAAGTMEFLGVNFYTRLFMCWDFNNPGWPGRHFMNPNAAEHTDMGWEVHPDSFYHVLMRCRRYGVPIMITENGAATREDEQRWRYIERHLYAMWRAMQDGVPIIGYLYWSLLDNFEWALGHDKRFGIIEITPELERRVRPSGHKLAEVYRTNQLTLNSFA